MKPVTNNAIHSLSRLLGAATLLGIVLSSSVEAHDFKQGSMVIAHPFIRVDTKCDGKITRAYIMLLANKGAQADKLTGVTLQAGQKGKLIATPASQTLSAIDLPPKSDTAVMPPNYVIEFAVPSKDLQTGGAIPGSLQFERAGKVAISFMVEPAPAGQGCTSVPAAPAPSSHHGHHSDKR
jgi:copper(I)-binding protein